MKMNASLAGIWMFVMMSLQTLGESSLSVDPNRPLYIREHSRLKLDCTYKGDNGHIKWTKDDVQVQEPHFATHTFRTAAFSGGKIQMVTNLTITKNNMLLRDSGVYACVSGLDMRAVRVKVLRVQTGSHVIRDPGGSITLQCDPASHDVDVLWTKNMTSLSQLPDLSGRIFLEARNRTLRIRNASLADSGQYECNLKPRDGVVQGNLSSKVVLSGSPYFPDGHNVSETVTVSKKRLELYCPAQGYPVPKVIWLAEGVQLNNSKETQFLSYRGVTAAVLLIEQYLPEIGENFVCEAFNQQGRTRRTFEILFVNSAQTIHAVDAVFILALFVSISINLKGFQS
ncbi:hemicentin-1-like [Haliotis rufescens]|uniref:hemicentin-1-like n=1 Tax=Haliotis rufescens TaxID=6454 RepID=UPI001EB09806|nr:hemicentin-1-like [Haliotis rufescens]XP_046366817.1 hemicentin-1-like [Haliotis rufescens]